MKSLLEDKKCFKNIMKQYSDDNVVFVGSAFASKDPLYRITQLLVDTAHNKESFEKIKEIHLGYLTNVSNGNGHMKTFHSILDELEHVVNLDFHNLSTEYRKELLKSYGERLSNTLLAAKMYEESVPVSYVSSLDCILISPEREPYMNETTKQIKKLVKPHLDNKKHVVVDGFIGRGKDNKIRTFEFGGSDYTATIFAAALKAESVDIWSDVGGVYDKDPSKHNDAKKYDNLSFDQAKKLANNGAKVIFPKTMDPLYSTKTKIRIRPIYDPSAKGTIISN